MKILLKHSFSFKAISQSQYNEQYMSMAVEPPLLNPPNHL